MLVTVTRHAVWWALLTSLARLNARCELHSARLINAADLAARLMAARLAVPAMRQAILLSRRNGQPSRHPILGQAIVLWCGTWQQSMRP